ncbi:hypothetical protein AB0K12_44690 [Nonomuraea sp. NPDC049419]|uniref:hypothetical protein n=1 Tax=Nonomuraea sp. NPDC049419 TaxID=3155772 RepID=UPI00342A1A07
MGTMTYPYQGKYVEGLLAEGKIQGFAEGKIQGRAEAVLEVLEFRGLMVSDEVRRRITSCQDLDVLRGCFRRAITAESVDDVFG